MSPQTFLALWLQNDILHSSSSKTEKMKSATIATFMFIVVLVAGSMSNVLLADATPLFGFRHHKDDLATTDNGKTKDVFEPVRTVTKPKHVSKFKAALLGAGAGIALAVATNKYNKSEAKKANEGNLKE